MRSLLGAMAITFGGFTAVKLLSIAKEMVIAHQYGRGAAIDSYQVAFALMNFFFIAVANTFPVALLPLYAERVKRDGPTAGIKFLRQIMFLTLLLVGGFALIILFARKPLLSLLAKGFDSDRRATAELMVVHMMPLVLLGPVVRIWAKLVNLKEKFAFPSLSEGVIPAAIIALVFCCSGSLGGYVLSIGTALGVVIQFLLMAFYAHRQGVLTWPALPSLREIRPFLIQLAPLMGVALIWGTAPLVDNAMASLLPAGSVATLGYAYKLPSLLVNTVSISMSTAVFSYATRWIVDGELSEERIKNLLILVLLISFPAAAFLYLLAPEIVMVLYQHGAFTASDGASVTHAIRMYAPMVGFYTLGMLFVTMLQADKKNHITSAIGLMNVFVNWTFNWLFMKIWGVSGIALSTTVVYLISLLLLSELSRRNFRYAPSMFWIPFLGSLLYWCLIAGLTSMGWEWRLLSYAILTSGYVVGLLMRSKGAMRHIVTIFRRIRH